MKESREIYIALASMLEKKEGKLKLQLMFPEMSFKIEASKSDTLLLEQTCWNSCLEKP